ncbi:MAG: DegT/DnrJ/EryC1/StrS family aminotransferase [Dethiobacter sp.]|nr:DegT/DnrJ/EryC1/StrS family aminotransferase [Dethiobacter sp.]
MKIAFSPPDITQDEINEVVDTLKSGWITTGPKTKLFEKQLANYCRTTKAAALNSATACMEMTLRLLGIGRGDEVITSAYTYSASASVIAHVGAKVSLVDSAKDSYHIDIDSLAEAITDKTKAVIPVDIAGVMCDYKSIFAAVESKKHLFQAANDLQDAFGRAIVIADAAHSLGAAYGSEVSGEAADFTAFSFHAVKNLTTAEGGAVTWREIDGIDSEGMYKQFMLLSLHGQSKDAFAKAKPGMWDYDIVAPHYKCNMTDMAAALGIAQLRRYAGILAKRRKIIEKYDELLSELNVSCLKHYTEKYTSSGHLYLVRLTEQDEDFRNNVIEGMAAFGVSTNVHYKPLPMHTAYKKLGFDIKDFPNAFEMYKNEISLPLHTLLSDAEVEYVYECFKKVLSGV